MTRSAMTPRGLQFLMCMCLCLCAARVQAAPTEGLTVDRAFPGLAVHALKSAKIVQLQDGLILKSQGMEIREAFLKEEIEKADPALKGQLKNNLFFLLEQEAMRRLLVTEAKKLSAVTGARTDEQALQIYLKRFVEGVTVSDGEVKSFFDKNKEMVGGTPFEQVKDGIREILLQEKRANLMDSHLRGLVERADFRIDGDWAKVQYPLAMDNPVDRGRSSGRPTIVEFGAAGCVPCDMMQPILDKLRKRYADKLNVVFVHVRENPVLATRFAIRSIPVQAFYNKEGKEVFRHVGFFPEQEVTKQLRGMGVQ